MGHIINWGIIGIFGIIFLTMVFTPFLCFSINKTNSEVSCNVGANIYVFVSIYSSYYSFILVGLGFILGALIGRAISLLDKEKYFLSERINKQERKKKFLWMWEYR